MSYDEWITATEFNTVIPSGLGIAYRKVTIIDLAGLKSIPINLLAEKIQIDMVNDTLGGLELISKGADLYRAVCSVALLRPSYDKVKDRLSYEDLKFISDAAMGGQIAENLKSSVETSTGNTTDSISK